MKPSLRQMVVPLWRRDDRPGPLAASSEPPCPHCGAVEGEPHADGCRRGPDAPVCDPPERRGVRRDLYPVRGDP